MTIYSTIPDDQAIVLPKKGTNFKGRLVSYAALAFALGAIVATSVGTASAPVTQIQPSLASEPAPAANEKPCTNFINALPYLIPCSHCAWDLGQSGSASQCARSRLWRSGRRDSVGDPRRRRDVLYAQVHSNEQGQERAF